MRDRIHVVLGADGAVGAAVVRQWAAQERPVRAVVRPGKAGVARAFPAGQVQIAEADALDAASVRRACAGAATVHHCVSAPYPLWEEVMPKITDNVLSACAAEKARLIFPGNIYGYGPLAVSPADETHPKQAQTVKGRLRNRLEARIREAAAAGGFDAVIPRFPSFYGPGVGNNLMLPIFKNALQGKKAYWMGSLDVLSDLIYIHDAGRACVLLAEDAGARGGEFHVASPVKITGGMFLEAIFREAGRSPAVGAYPKWMISLIGLFDREAAHMKELFYLFERPSLLDAGRFQARYPEFKYTTFEEGIRKTLDWVRAAPSR